MTKKKTIREQSIEELLAQLIILANNSLTKLEQLILKEVLIHNRTFEEITQTIRLPILRQKQLFNIAVKRIGKILSSVNENIPAYQALAEANEKLTATRQELASLQNSIKKRQELSPGLQELLATPLDTIKFSARVLNICAMNEMETLADIVRYSRKDFFNKRNIGLTSINEVEAFLTSQGLFWNMEI